MPTGKILGADRPVKVYINIELKQKNLALQDEISVRQRTEQEKEILIKKLKESFDQVKTLKGFIPICASCKKIRDDQEFWNRIESYIEERSEAEFFHSICPDCAKKLYPDLDIYDEKLS
jgi:hypothetical protein